MISLMDNQNNQEFNSQQPESSKPSLLSKLKLLLSENKFIVIIICALSIISFSTTGYLLVANKTPSPSVNTPSVNLAVSTPPPTLPPPKTAEIPTRPLSPTPNPAVTVTESEIATWSAFLSAKYSYSIKYLPNWTATISAQQDSKILEYVVFNPKEATTAGTLSITLSYGTRTYSEALVLDPQQGEIITIASTSATKKNKKDSNGNESVSVIIPTGARTIVMYAQKKYQQILDQILSTLKL